MPPLRHQELLSPGTLNQYKLYLFKVTLAMVSYHSQQRAVNVIAVIKVTSESFYRKLGQALRDHYLRMSGSPGVTQLVNYTVGVQTQTNLIPKLLF